MQIGGCCSLIFLCSNSLNAESVSSDLPPCSATGACHQRVQLCFPKSNFCNEFQNILRRCVFSTLSLLMGKGQQGGEVLWHRLAACLLCRLSLGAACSSVPSHGPARAVPALLSCLLFQTVSFQVLNHPEFLHRNPCASSGKPSVNQAGVLPGQTSLASPPSELNPAVGLRCSDPGVGLALLD